MPETFNIHAARFSVSSSCAITKANTPVPSSPQSFFQSESRCEIFVMGMSSNANMNEELTDISSKDFALRFQEDAVVNSDISYSYLKRSLA